MKRTPEHEAVVKMMLWMSKRVLYSRHQYKYWHDRHEALSQMWHHSCSELKYALKLFAVIWRNREKTNAPKAPAD